MPMTDIGDYVSKFTEFEAKFQQFLGDVKIIIGPNWSVKDYFGGSKPVRKLFG